MSEDWKAGDLALCIKMGPWTEEGGSTDGPRCGQYLTVNGTKHFDNGLGLSFDAWRKDHFLSDRFVKITPMKPSKDDLAVIRDMKRKKLTAKAPVVKVGKLHG